MEFNPSVYEHAARVIDASPWDVSRSLELLANSHIEAFRLYDHRPVVVGIDIYNLEAEAYGAIVEKPADRWIPAISRHPYSTSNDLIALEPLDPRKDGRISMVIEAARRIADERPRADVRVPLAGPFSIASNLIGPENLLCEVIRSPDNVAKALRNLVVGQVEFCKEVVRHGLDIAFFESAAAPPLLSPEQFERIELPALEDILEKTGAVVGHAVPCIIGGDTAPILESILQTGTGYVCCPAQTNQQAFMDKMKEQPEVTVRINMDLRPIAANSWPAVEKEVDRILTLAENRDNVCIGTGCLPYETDPGMVLRIKAYILSKSA